GGGVDRLRLDGLPGVIVPRVDFVRFVQRGVAVNGLQVGDRADRLVGGVDDLVADLYPGGGGQAGVGDVLGRQVAHRRRDVAEVEARGRVLGRRVRVIDLRLGLVVPVLVRVARRLLVLERFQVLVVVRNGRGAFQVRRRDGQCREDLPTLVNERFHRAEPR